MDDMPLPSDAGLTRTGLFPCRALAQVWKGEVLVAESERALTTALPESNGRFLVPEADVRMDRVRELVGGGDLAEPGPEGAELPLAWRDARTAADGARLIGFTPGGDLRILLTDRSPGAEGGVATVNRFPRWGDMNDLLRLLDIEPAGESVYEGPCYGDVRRNVVEGSQLLAQTLVAAAKSAPGQRAISAHTIFSRPAVFDRPLRFAVTAPRRGRAFSTLSVETTQDGKPIASGLVLLDKGAEDLIRGQAEPPKVPGPAESKPFDFGVIGREVRFVGGDYDPDPDRIGPPELYAWVRHRENPAELYLKQAMLAQPTGHFTIAAAMLPHKGFGEAMAHRTISTGVLAITIALHEDPDLTGWLLYANPSTYAGRGLVQGEGRIFTEAGRLVASYTVQAMIRAFDQDPTSYGLKSDRLM
jgi:acyl-CoA thioesterase